jgi:hypothetical protein
VIIKKPFLTLLATSFFVALPVSGQSGPRPAASAPSNAPHGPPAAQTLTAEQLAKVKSVLAAYKPATLTTDDAKMISVHCGMQACAQALPWTRRWPMLDLVLKDWMY